jgi:hypothetical protein
MFRGDVISFGKAANNSGGCDAAHMPSPGLELSKSVDHSRNQRCCEIFALFIRFAPKNLKLSIFEPPCRIR